LKVRPPVAYGWKTSSSCGPLARVSSASTGTRATRSTSAAARTRRSSRSRTTATERPSSNPSIAPVARLSFLFGLVGVLGSCASLMILPALTVSVVRSLSLPLSELSWLWLVLRWLSRLGRDALSRARSASFELIWVRLVLSCLTLLFRAEICASMPACALASRLRRYASAKACDPVCARAGSDAL
jgi:hypothetical protein